MLIDSILTPTFSQRSLTFCNKSRPSRSRGFSVGVFTSVPALAKIPCVELAALNADVAADQRQHDFLQDGILLLLLGVLSRCPSWPDSVNVTKSSGAFSGMTR